MLISQDIPLVRKEFFELYELLSKQSILKDDVISMGNLALFVDYSHNRYKWLEKKKTITDWTLKKDANEVNMFIASHLYDIAIRLEISDNLPFKLKKMSSTYKDNKLRYFDMVLDPYEFPDWFKTLMRYLPIPSKKELYMKLLERIKKYPSIQQKGNQVALAYFVDRFHNDEKLLSTLAELEDILQDQTENELAWFLAMNIFGYYYPEMEKMNQKSEQEYALKKMRKFKVEYEQKNLLTFDLFTDSMKEKLLEEFSRGT